MAIPALKLNLVPAPTPWRRHHHLLGLGILALGVVCLGLVSFATIKAYVEANRAGQQAVALTAEARKAAERESRIQEELQSIDVAKEQPRWRLAERILLERSVPWSRITAELERTLVQDVRLKSIQRIRPAGTQTVQIKLKGETRTREAEVDFMDTLKQNTFFLTPVFERESERQGGGMEFELTLPVNPDTPEYQPLPKHGRAPKHRTAAAPVAAPVPAPQPNPRRRAYTPTPSAAVPTPPTPAVSAPTAAPADPAQPRPARRWNNRSRELPANPSRLAPTPPTPGGTPGSTPQTPGSSQP